MPLPQVCNPVKDVYTSEQEWADLKAQWAEQQRSPFVLYKLVRAALLPCA